jgi:hypothetical protein
MKNVDIIPNITGKNIQQSVADSEHFVAKVITFTSCLQPLDFADRFFWLNYLTKIFANPAELICLQLKCRLLI